MSDNKSIVNQSAQKFSKRYEDNPLTALLLTSLSVIVPQIAIGKEAIDRAVTKIQKERFQTLLDELAKGHILLTPEIIESEEFIHSFVVVYRAALNTFQREKIRRFARILLKAIELDELASDTFEEFVKILETVTEREVFLLSLLSDMEKQYLNSEINERLKEDNIQNWMLETTIFIWDEYLAITHDKHKIDKAHLKNILQRVQGMGLYIEGARIIAEKQYQVGTTTTLFDKFAEWIQIEEKVNSAL